MSASATTAPGVSRVRWGARIWDALIVLALLALSALGWVSLTPPPPPAVVALGIVGIVVLLWRRALPVIVLAITAPIAVASAVLGAGGAEVFPVAIACAAATAEGKRRLGAGVAGAVGVVVVAILLLRGVPWDSAAVGAIPLALALGVTVGLVQDARRRLVQDAVDRADRAEALRDAEARRAVAEERLRIARELHDVLAHEIAVIGVQTGLAEYVLDDDPAAARAALTTARSAGSTALTELATLLQLLRRTDDDPITAPTPSLRRVDALFDDLRRTGLVIEARIDRPLPDLPPVIDLAAYRVLQEGLTNAHKHGDGHAEVVVRAEDGTVAISIRNAPGSAMPPAPSTGFGLVGMRERVEGVGGTLTASAAPEAFVVDAVLPIGRVSAREKGDRP